MFTWFRFKFQRLIQKLVISSSDMRDSVPTELNNQVKWNVRLNPLPVTIQI